MHVFVSDAHIRKDDSYRARVFRKFLHDIGPEMNTLYILGDLFEFWFEYRIVFPKEYFKTLALLYGLTQRGVAVHYVLGNHEVMTGSLLTNFGFRVHRDFTEQKIDGKRVFVAHGHKVDRRLWTTAWELLLTSRLNHRLYELIHPDIGVFLAQGIAYLSRKQRRNPHHASMLLERFAEHKLKEVDLVVLAHSHVPVFRAYDDHKCYVNTGNWVTDFTYGVIDNGRVALEYYKP
ncbi:UDP-2,3-diacylglucosamine diphosphatase [candidate division WOR-3 bacterium]|nr:UDP-2,3-diacylglucosamine diphosphatase [candidate division WOR-3 bacterium]